MLPQKASALRLLSCRVIAAASSPIPRLSSSAPARSLAAHLDLSRFFVSPLPSLKYTLRPMARPCMTPDALLLASMALEHRAPREPPVPSRSTPARLEQPPVTWASAAGGCRASQLKPSMMNIRQPCVGVMMSWKSWKTCRIFFLSISASPTRRYWPKYSFWNFWNSSSLKTDADSAGFLTGASGRRPCSRFTRLVTPCRPESDMGPWGSRGHVSSYCCCSPRHLLLLLAASMFLPNARSLLSPDGKWYLSSQTTSLREHVLLPSRRPK
ncbi:hypothetical protein CRUP_038149 [Coryphaenoides rupestris]|nr:hypothetical protein CRUP_038149 [Coryphaenoides rupestris]